MYYNYRICITITKTVLQIYKIQIPWPYEKSYLAPLKKLGLLHVSSDVKHAYWIQDFGVAFDHYRFFKEHWTIDEVFNGDI